MTKQRRNLLLCCAWIVSFILAGGLLWLCTQSLRTNILIRSANRVLARSGETRRLDARLPAPAGLGTWFTLIEVPGNGAVPGRAFVFTLMNGTRTASCAAFVNGPGKVEKIIPLSDYAELVLEDLPEEIYGLYKDRIESLFRSEDKRRK